MKIALLFLTYPISWGIFKLKLWDLIPEKISTFLLRFFVLLTIILVVSPVSFIGNDIDYAIILLALIIIFTFGLKKQKEGKNTGKILVWLGKSSLIIFALLIIALISNPLLFAYSFDLDGQEPEAVTRLNNITLEHYRKNSNFTYPGNHIIKIKKNIIPSFIEINKGKVNIGEFDQFDLPNTKITLLYYKKDGSSETMEVSQTIYDVNESKLIKKKYDTKSNSFIVEKEFEY